MPAKRTTANHPVSEPAPAPKAPTEPVEVALECGSLGFTPEQTAAAVSLEVSVFIGSPLWPVYLAARTEALRELRLILLAKARDGRIGAAKTMMQIVSNAVDADAVAEIERAATRSRVAAMNQAEAQRRRRR
ncbi:MAG: hypothetical protein GX595_11170 [Lentisphaerae bacterium]|nr:hypothetical protein [Lentisphaerota bacterium]